MSSRMLRALCAVTFTAAAALMIGGCPNPNTAPVANAGVDQTVSVNAVVTLSGIGTDADGNPLTFAWTQTAGTPTVTINNATSATASFTAPNTATVLTFQLTVSDGTDTNADTVVVTVQANAPATERRLYVACFTGNRIVSFLNPGTLNGNVAPSTNLSGAQTLLTSPADIVVTASNVLLAANFAGQSITSYDSANTTNGNFAPNRNVQGAATGLIGPVSLAVNRTNDLVFTALAAGNSIFVYNGASTAAFNGNLAPVRTITSADINTVRGINLDANDNLYVANNAGAGSIAVFANASSRNGTIAADRVITSASFNAIFDVFIDGADRMYVVNSALHQVLVFNNASTLNGARMPDSILTITGGTVSTAVAVDTNGVGYVVDNTANAVFAFDNIATRNGTFAADRTLSGANTQLVGPIRVFLVE